MSSKLFVGGLSWNTDEGLLSDTFSKFGDLSEVKIITDRETGHGFWFQLSMIRLSESSDRSDGRNRAGRTSDQGFCRPRS